MHPDQNQFLAIGILSILLLIGFFSVPEDKWQSFIVLTNSMLCWWWAGLFLKYKFKRNSLVKIKASDFLSKARLYQNTSNLINCPTVYLSHNLKHVIQNTHKRTVYKVFALVMLSICLAFAGVITFVGLGIITFTGVGIVAFAFALVGTSVGAVTEVVAFTSFRNVIMDIVESLVKLKDLGRGAVGGAGKGVTTVASVVTGGILTTLIGDPFKDGIACTVTTMVAITVLVLSISLFIKLQKFYNEAFIALNNNLGKENT